MYLLLQLTTQNMYHEQKRWCCTSELQKGGKCDRVGDIILAEEVRARNSSGFFWWDLQFNHTKTSFLSREHKVGQGCRQIVLKTNSVQI